MGKLKISGPVKIITGLIFNDSNVSDKAMYLLSRRLGPIESESRVFPFNHTRYYEEELGSGLARVFLSFRRLKDPENIYKLKIFTNSLENRLSASGRRRINIDPGYLNLSKLVLLTTKDYSHRTYLKKGISAEVTLVYKKGAYEPWEWTYPDYKTKDYIHFFNGVREAYLKDLKNLR